jgi:chromosome segregation ATPase
MEEILIQIYEWFFGNPYGVTMAVIDPVVGGALISGAVSLIGGLFGGGAARKRARAAAREKKRLEGKLTALENSRQAITNPYQDFKDVSSLATDLSGMVSNPYASLGVATQAAEMQVEEADIALANTLDTLRATGASAGGATALAQAALQSKKGVSASIEAQEAQNEKLKAQGQSQLEQLKMQEAQRIQGVQMSEAQRIQQAGAAGKEFMFRTKEDREMQQLNRVSAQISGAQQQQIAAQQAGASMTSSMIGALGSIGGAYVGSLGK